MALNVPTGHSLKTRITFATLIVFVISIWSLTLYAGRMLRADMQALLSEQQFSTVSLVAGEVDHEIEDRLKALETIAGALGPAILANPRALQENLAQRIVLQRQFNGGIFVTDADGTTIASLPLSADRLGVNYMERDYIAAALNEGKATVSKPVIGKRLKAPVVSMAAPIQDDRGRVIGALAGVTDLSKPNFLDRLTANSYSKTGGYLLVAARHRLIVTATDKSRVMETLPALGINPTVDRFVRGEEGSAVFVNPLGVEVLASARGIPLAGWYMVALLPTAEAFAPIRGMQQRMLLAAVVLTLLACWITWWILSRQLSPMLAAAKTLATLTETDQIPQPLAIARRDEVGQLIAGFNRLLASLRQREAAREEALTRLQKIASRVPGVVYQYRLRADGSSCFPFASEAIREIYRVSPEEVRDDASRVLATLHPDDHDAILASIQQSARDLSPWSHEYRVKFADGTVRWLFGNALPQAEADGSTLWHGFITDITERNRQDERIRELLQEQRLIFDNAHVGILLLKNRIVLKSNQRIADMFGFPSPADLEGKSTAILYCSPEDFAAIGREGYAQLAKNGFANFEAEMCRQDGAHIWVIQTGRPLEPGAVLDAASIWVYTDITERRLIDVALRQSEQMFSTAFSSAPVAASIAAAEDGRILAANHNYERDFGWTQAEMIGRTSVEIGIWPDEATRRPWAELIRREGRLVDYETIWMHKSGTRRNVSISGEITELDGKPCILAYATDITERKQAEERIRELAYFDQLTGLPNRILLQDRLKQAMTASGRSGNHGALLFIDLDNFKSLNDTLGHDVGDLLLKQVTHRLMKCVREGDTVARLGGDEFVVILANLSLSEREAATGTETVAEKILATLNQIYRFGELAHQSTASIGATLFKGTLIPIDDLMKQADLTMYKAKAAGRNKVRFFDPAMEVAVKARATLENDLRRSLEAERFLLHYQAQVVGNGNVTGAEVLLRWQHPRRGMISPAEFIPLAEETGLIMPLGHWILQTACTQLAAWASRPEMAHLTLAVNVSAVQFHQVDFVEEILAVLRHTGANPQRLKLELTESLLAANVAEIVEKMYALKAKGVGFALDDFGTGYSSLSYLKRLPLDQLKIDQSFVRDVLIDPNDAAIARTIVALAQSLGLGVIAEGVETTAQRDFLASSGCHAYQGYLYSRPLALEQFGQFVQQARRTADEAAC